MPRSRTAARAKRQAVEQLALVEQGGVGGVEVLRARLAERPAAEAHDPAAAVVDREDHALAEAVEARPAVLGARQQAGLQQRRLGVALGLQRALERRAVVGRVAEAEAQDRLAVEPAAGQIARGRGALVALQPPGEPARRGGVGGIERVVDRGCRVLAALRRRQAGELRQPGDRLPEVQPLDRHHEVDRVAVLPAAEAVIEAFGFRDRERGRFFPMERAQAGVLATAAGQADVAPDDVDQGQPCLELVERDRALVSHRHRCAIGGRCSAGADARAYRPLVELAIDPVLSERSGRVNKRCSGPQPSSWQIRRRALAKSIWPG